MTRRKEILYNFSWMENYFITERQKMERSATKTNVFLCGKIAESPGAIYQVALEYEADGVSHFSAYTHKGDESMRFSLKLWTDAEDRVFGSCTCVRGAAGLKCEHMKKAFQEIGGN